MTEKENKNSKQPEDTESQKEDTETEKPQDNLDHDYKFNKKLAYYSNAFDFGGLNPGKKKK